MNSSTRSLVRSLVTRTAVAAAAFAACNAASALSSFTLDPSAIPGVTGATAFTADNLKVSDFATVTYTATGFTETGYLQVINAQNGNSVVSTPGLNTSYGLYIAFTSAGTNVVSANGFTAGNLTSLSYTFYGTTGGMYNPATSTVLGTGSLASGTNVFSSTASGTTVTTATANADLSFTENMAYSSFFVSPNPFYSLSQTSFTNNTDTIASSASGFTVTAGAGSVTFTTPVPEPETYALMLGGLAAIGFVARRRTNG